MRHRSLMSRKNSQGYAILSVLIVFVIIAVLTQSYFTTDTPTGQPYAVYTRDRARQTVQTINLRSAQTDFFMRTEGRRPPIEELRRHLAELSTRFNVGGRLFLDPNDSLQVTTSIQTPRFREALGLPASR